MSGRRDPARELIAAIHAAQEREIAKQRAKAPRGARRPDNAQLLDAFGRALLHFAKTGKRDRLDACGLSAAVVAEAIIAIARGEDAREVFRQTGAPGRQSEAAINRTRAYVYWLARAQTPADVAGAVRQAQSHFEYLPEPTRATIGRLARTHRDYCLALLARAPGIDLAPLRAQLAKHSRHGRG
ncbi:MAG: hypothetical protein IT519_14145 [Burkholderiales bacterium]|nr:hypothetical protein [Burkholderiales bacterium]